MVCGNCYAYGYCMLAEKHSESVVMAGRTVIRIAELAEVTNCWACMWSIFRCVGSDTSLPDDRLARFGSSVCLCCPPGHQAADGACRVVFQSPRNGHLQPLALNTVLPQIRVQKIGAEAVITEQLVLILDLGLDELRNAGAVAGGRYLGTTYESTN
jgi:hypothetical protein